MIIWTSPDYGFSAPYSGGIDLLQPLTAATVFRIVAQTPVVHAKKSDVRPLQTIHTIWVSPTARISDDAELKEPPISLCVGNPAGVTIDCDDSDSKGYTATILQVLKIGGREYIGPERLKSWTGHFAPHVEVSLNQEALEPFVQQVSRASTRLGGIITLIILRRQWSFLASAHPQILLPRLGINIRQAVPRSTSLRILQELQSTYARYLDVFHHLSFNEGWAYGVVQLQVEWDDPEQGDGQYDAKLTMCRVGGEVRMDVKFKGADELEDESHEGE